MKVVKDMKQDVANALILVGSRKDFYEKQKNNIIDNINFILNGNFDWFFN